MSSINNKKLFASYNIQYQRRFAMSQFGITQTERTSVRQIVVEAVHLESDKNFQKHSHEFLKYYKSISVELQILICIVQRELRHTLEPYLQRNDYPALSWQLQGRLMYWTCLCDCLPWSHGPNAQSSQQLHHCHMFHDCFFWSSFSSSHAHCKIMKM